VSSLSANEISKKYPGIIDVLRYHVATGRYSYVDRISAAMDAKVVEETIREALRSVMSIIGGSYKRDKAKECKYDKDAKTYVPTDKDFEIVYVESEEYKNSDSIPGRVWLHAKIGYDDKSSRYRVFFAPPMLPSDSELADFIDSVRKDLEVARVVASLAMTKRSKEE